MLNTTQKDLIRTHFFCIPNLHSKIFVHPKKNNPAEINNPSKENKTTKKHLPDLFKNSQNLRQSYLKKNRSPTMECLFGMLSMEEVSQLFGYYVLLQHLLPAFPRRRAAGQKNHLVAYIQLHLDCLR